MKFYIYKLTCILNNKIYIGQTKNLQERLLFHSKGNKKYLIGRAIKKYGWNNFQVDVLDEVENRICSDNVERKYIKLFKSFDKRFGYNISLGGYNDISEKTKKKISKTMIDKGISKGKNNSMFGKHRFGKENPFYCKRHSKETKQKIRDKRKLQVITDEHKEILRNLWTGSLNPMKNKYVSNKVSKSKRFVYEQINDKGNIIKIDNLKIFCNKNKIRYGSVLEVVNGHWQQYNGYVYRRIDK